MPPLHPEKEIKMSKRRGYYEGARVRQWNYYDIINRVTSEGKPLSKEAIVFFREISVMKLFEPLLHSRISDAEMKKVGYDTVALSDFKNVSNIDDVVRERVIWYDKKYWEPKSADELFKQGFKSDIGYAILFVEFCRFVGIPAFVGYLARIGWLEQDSPLDELIGACAIVMVPIDNYCQLKIYGPSTEEEFENVLNLNNYDIKDLYDRKCVNDILIEKHDLDY
jgi:hypothetical protein